MTFTLGKSTENMSQTFVQFSGTEIEVSHYKYLGITTDQSRSFTLHVQYLVKNWDWIEFFFSLESSPVCLLKQKNNLSVLDYGDILYMHSSSQCLHALDTVAWSLEIHHKLKISHSSLFAVFSGRVVLPHHSVLDKLASFYL